MGEKAYGLLNGIGIGVVATLTLVTLLTDVVPSELRSVTWWSLGAIGAAQIAGGLAIALGAGRLDPGLVSRRYWALCLALTGATWIAMAWSLSLILLPLYSVIPEWKLLAGVLVLIGWRSVSWARWRAHGKHLAGDEDVPKSADLAERSGHVH